MNLTKIVARQSAFLAKKLLTTAKYVDIYGGMGEGPQPRKDTLPLHSSTSVKWRRYEQIPKKTTPLVEGVTPDASTLLYTDLDVTLNQYGDYVILTDLSIETVEDPTLSIAGEKQGDQAIGSLTSIREGVLIAGTNVYYANGAQRTDVNTLITKALISKAVRKLGSDKARRLTKMLTATSGFNTTPIPATYVGVCSTYTKYDMEETIGESGGFLPAEKYSQTSPLFPMEFGKLGHVRWIENVDMTFFADGGGNKGATHKSTGGVKEDVYAALIFGEEGYGICPFGGYTGKDGVKGIVKPLGSGGTEDPLNQRASVGWKTMQAAKRLNELWMIRLEHGVTA